MWESVQAVIFGHSIIRAFVSGFAVANILLLGIIYLVRFDSPETNLALSTSGEDRRKYISMESDAATAVTRVGFWLNGSACGATLLLITALVNAQAKFSDVIHVLEMYLFGIFFGILAIAGRHAVIAYGVSGEGSLGYRAVLALFNIFALSFFFSGGIQLIAVLRAME